MFRSSLRLPALRDPEAFFLHQNGGPSMTGIDNDFAALIAAWPMPPAE